MTNPASPFGIINTPVAVQHRFLPLPSDPLEDFRDLSRNSSPLNRQNELIRSLRKQLQATERELQDQKWVFQQFLKSPAWRLTYPIRWLVRQCRALRDWVLQRKTDALSENAAAHPVAAQEDLSTEYLEASSEFKRAFTNIYRVQLESFLTSNATLQLPTNDNPEISILIVLFNRAELTLACLRSLAENHLERMEIIIVDNNSQDDTPRLLQRVRGARIFRNTENRNFLLGINQAAKEARGEYLLILNNDTQVLPGTLQSALRAIRSAPDIGAVGGRLILLDGTLQEAGNIVWRDGSCLGYGRGDNPFAPMYMFRRDVDYCSGAFLLTLRRIWEEVHGFDEIFKPAYYEETDYCTRLWERQLRVIYEPKAVLLHYEFASSDSQSSAIDLQREHQSVFAARHRKLLTTHFEPDPNSILVARMKDQGKRRVLFIDDRVPHRWLGSGFPRARAILQAMLNQSCFVTFYPLTEFNEDWTSVYSDMSAEVEFMKGYGPPMLEAFLRSRANYYDTLFVSRPHNMQILRSVLAGHSDWFERTTIVYDAEAIFATRELTFRQLNGQTLSAEEADALLKEEVDLAALAHCVIAVSKIDGGQFRRHGVENVRIVGHSLAPAPTPRTFDQRKGFLFVGAIHEEASPNGDSVIWFLEEILPKIRAELGPDIPFTIAGVSKSERVRKLATTSVNITEHVPDLTPLYDSARVFVAPTRYAAGIPHKIHEAAARGIPVVATPLLASQLGWDDGDSLLVGSNVETFAQKCIQLYSDETLWTRLRNNGLDRIAAECSVETFEQSVAACLAPRKQMRQA